MIVDTSYKTFFKTTVIAAAAFGVPMGIVAGIVVGIARGVSGGVPAGGIVAIAAGLPFGLMVGFFTVLQRQRVDKTRPEFKGEELVHDGPANHFLNYEGVGGWLFLTKERLFFRSHHFNIQRHELSIAVDDIAEVQPVRTARIFSNGLRVVTRSGRDERFVVQQHRRWCEQITRLQRARLTSSSAT